MVLKNMQIWYTALILSVKDIVVGKKIKILYIYILLNIKEKIKKLQN